jgi:hypothetical protein
MYSVQKHFVEFTIHHQVKYGEAVYIVGNLEELSSPIRMDVLDDIIWSQRVYINVDKYDVDSAVVQYKYFVALFDHPKQVINDIKPIVRSFKLKVLKNNFMMVHDKADCEDWDKRITVKDPRKLMHFDLVLPCHVDFGEAIYVLGPLEEVGAQNIQQAHRMELHPQDKWKITVALDPELALKRDDVLTFMFIRSYYSRRDPNHWIVIGKARSLDMKKSPFHSKRDIKGMVSDKPCICEVTIKEDICEWKELQGDEKTTKIMGEKPIMRMDENIAKIIDEKSAKEIDEKSSKVTDRRNLNVASR